MSLLGLKLISLAAIFIVSILGGLYPLYRKSQGEQHCILLPIPEALAIGIFLGAGLLHMLGDSAEGFISLGYSYPMPFLLAGSVFLLLLLLEHMQREVSEHKGTATPGFALLAVLILSIHSFLEGAALGLGSTLSAFLIIFSAIIAHKWAEAFALATQISKSTLSNRMGLILFSVFAVMTPIGIVIGDMITQHMKHIPLMEPVFSALAGGTFLYLGTLHGLSQSFMVKQCCNLRHFLFVILGFTIMAVVAIWT